MVVMMTGVAVIVAVVVVMVLAHLVRCAGVFVQKAMFMPGELAGRI
jgi:hypothetical protein